MYNLYIHQKKLLDLEKSSNEKKSLSKNESKRKKKINSLTKNYNERMKNFVMNLCKDPIILGQNDIEIPQTKSEKNNEIEKRNHFIFGNYMTDKEKVEIINKEREVLNKIEEMNKNCQKKRDIINARKNNCDILIQPRMKFGPRQEIENLIDNINKNGVNHIFVSRKYSKIVSEYLKKFKDNNVRYVKGYDILKNSYGDNYNDIKNILSKDENKENEYFYKDVISSKLSHNNNIKEYKNKKIKIMEYKDSTKNKFYMPITKKIPSLQNNFKSNELKKMFNDNRKMYFNGASQFINLKLVKPKKKNHLSEDEISIIYTDKNIYFKKINNVNGINKNNNEHGNKLSRQQSMPNILNDNSKINNKIFTPINQNQNSHESYIKKYLYNLPKNSNKNQILEENLFSNENYDNVQGLCEESKIKRMKMHSLINKEINKSIIKNYIDKYDIINEFNKNNVINTNNLFFQSGNHIIEKVDDNLGGKLKYLVKVIQRRNQELMKENNSNVYINSSSHFKVLNKNEKKKKRKFANNDFMLIDGQFIAKNDIKTLSDVMFTKCNFYKMKKSQSQRNFFKNEEKFEKKQGLNVNNFYSKMSP